MADFIAANERLRDFLSLGAPILLVLILVIALMWVLIFERLTYLWTGHCCGPHAGRRHEAHRADEVVASEPLKFQAGYFRVERERRVERRQLRPDRGPWGAQQDLVSVRSEFLYPHRGRGLSQ